MKGEELTVSYLPDQDLGGLEERRAYLRDSHNFRCMGGEKVILTDLHSCLRCLCSSCTLEGMLMVQEEYTRKVARGKVGMQQLNEGQRGKPISYH